jgi:hypothetical protein
VFDDNMLKFTCAIVTIIVVNSVTISQPINDGTNPTQPVSRFDVRNSFFMDWQEFENDRYYNVFSVGAGLILDEQKFNLRIDIPAVLTNVTFRTTGGLGDIFAQAEYIFGRNENYAFITGVTFIFPTATKDEIGFGNYIIAPLLGGIYSTEWGFWGILIRDYYSFTRENYRTKIHELSLQPMVKLNLGKGWYTVFKPDIRINWISKRVFIPYTQEFGLMLSKNFRVSLTGGFHLSNADKRYDWIAELRISYLFQ